jgi:NTE family protein
VDVIDQAVNNAAVRASPPVPARAWAALVVGSATVVLIILDAGFIALAFPEIEESFPASSRTTLGWVSSGYFISLSAFMLVAGWLGDRVGRRRVFFAGLGIFALGALLTGCSTSVSMLISSRVVQGLGAAALTPVSLAMVLPAFPASRRATAVGVWGVAGALAGIVAPTGGAFLIEIVGWRAPFFTFVPLAALAWLMGRRVLPDEPGDDPEGTVDPWGILAATTTVAAIAVVVTQGDGWGWGDQKTLVFVTVVLISAPTLLYRAKHHIGTPLDLDLFQVRSYASASVVSFLSQAAFFSFFFSIPLFLIEIWEWSTIEAGFAIALNQLSAAVVGISAGRWADRHGHSGVIIAGGVVAGVGYAWLAFGAGPDPEVWTVLFPAFIVGGCGSMMIGSTISAAAFRDIDDASLGRASGSYYVTRRLGSAAGAIAAVAILGESVGAEAIERFRWIWTFSAACYLAAAMAMWFSFDQTRPAAEVRSR